MNFAVLMGIWPLKWVNHQQIGGWEMNSSYSTQLYHDIMILVRRTAAFCDDLRHVLPLTMTNYMRIIMIILNKWEYRLYRWIVIISSWNITIKELGQQHNGSSDGLGPQPLQHLALGWTSLSDPCHLWLGPAGKIIAGFIAGNIIYTFLFLMSWLYMVLHGVISHIYVYVYIVK